MPGCARCPPRIAAEIKAAKPDAVILFGNDQDENFGETGIPQFAIYTGASTEVDDFLKLLQGLASNDPLPPVVVVDLPDGAYRYRVRDGFHRYYLALACGFTCLPVALDPFAEEWM